MLRAIFVFAALAALQAGAALAEEPAFEPLQPLDLTNVDPEFAEDMFGRWTIRDAGGERACGIELMRETGIGGMQVGVDPSCEAVFPVMGDITAWRLLEGWTIDLADAERKTRIRFSTPDERYVAYPEVDGIATIEPEPMD
ncbi:AprI/Inh family metalloprotease inhibitor [Mesorhizobium sp. PUT5]|uniref:AprI/Inh family metalloprotease inhibitor n=1 Tax=Mesorhizobium sp. PUT5 TaxID=3454629 RepID=UPI003FA48BC0